VAYWGGGGAAGWGGGRGGGGGGRMGRIDGWDYDELGVVYDPALVRRLVPYLAPYKTRAVIALISMIVNSIANYTQPFIMAIGIQRVVDNLRVATNDSLDQSVRDAAFEQAGSDVTTFGTLLVGLSLVFFAAQFVQRRMTGHVGHSILRDMRSLMFAHLNRLSLSFYDREEIGRVMSRVTSDVVTLQELMTTGFLNVLADIIGLAIIIALIIRLDPMLAGVMMVVVPLLVGFMAIWQKYAAQAFIRVRQAIALVNSNINENVSGVRVVQSLGREEENLRQFDELNRQNRDMNMDAARLQAAVMPLVEVLSTVATVLVRRGLRLHHRLPALHPALLQPGARHRPPVHDAPAGHGRRAPHLRGARHRARDPGRA
jgi:ATP-binding cassette subfamily B protein